MSQETNIRQLVINKLTDAQYEQAVKNADELYLTPDTDSLPSQTGNSGKYLTTNGTTTSWASVPAGTVTSVRVQATSPVQSSQNTAQTGTLNTTISLADGYGDTKNPYASKTANTVLAAPNGSNGVPAFRALVKADIPLASETAASGGTTTSLVTTGEKYTWNSKQDALSTQTAYTNKGSATKVPQITTNTLGQVTGITEVTITQPIVNNKTITIQKNSTTVDSFTLNQSTDKTINITVPTKTSDITNDSGFLTSHQSIKTLKTDNTTGQTASSSETITGSGTINLHKISKTGSYSDLLNKPTIPATNVIPATTTANKVLVSTTTSGTAKWSDFSTAGLLKTNTSGVVSVDTTSYGTYSKPSGGIPASDLAESYYLASNPNGYTSNAGTVTSVRVQAGTGLASSTSTAQSTTLNTTISIASGYKLPTTTEWSNKQDKLTTQTAYTSKGSTTKVPQITTNTLGQVTGITEVDITQPTVNNSTILLTQGGVNKGSFTLNQATDSIIDFDKSGAELIIVDNSGSTLPTPQTIGETFLNTTDKKIYTAEAGEYVVGTNIIKNGDLDLSNGEMDNFSSTNYLYSTTSTRYQATSNLDVHFKTGLDVTTKQCFISMYGYTSSQYKHNGLGAIYIENGKLYVLQAVNSTLTEICDIQINKDYHIEGSVGSNYGTGYFNNIHVKENDTYISTLTTSAPFAYPTYSPSTTFTMYIGIYRGSDGIITAPFLGTLYGDTNWGGEIVVSEGEIGWDDGTALVNDTICYDTTNEKTYYYNNNTLYEGDGSVDIDNSSITLNGNSQIQTVGVKDVRSSNTIKTWTGTRAQYDAIVTKDANTLYNITDDTDTTAAMLELLYPVGAVYIGTMDVCPLATLGIGSWEKIAEDQVLQGSSLNHNAGTTIAAGLPNITGSINRPGQNNTSGDSTTNYLTGSFYFDSSTYSRRNTSESGTGYLLKFDASRSSSIYGNSDTVQPPAFVVNIWRRIS